MHAARSEVVGIKVWTLGWCDLGELRCRGWRVMVVVVERGVNRQFPL